MNKEQKFHYYLFLRSIVLISIIILIVLFIPGQPPSPPPNIIFNQPEKIINLSWSITVSDVYREELISKYNMVISNSTSNSKSSALNSILTYESGGLILTVNYTDSDHNNKLNAGDSFLISFQKIPVLNLHIKLHIIWEETKAILASKEFIT
jgi:hypothetical protein